MSKGFTLIELLIVIGILAILATATVLVLNPTELFAQARDAQRLADLDTLRSAITLFLSSVTGPSLQGGAFTCVANFGNSAAISTTNRRFKTALSESQKGVRTPDGNGWVPVNFKDNFPGGAPFGALPVDPTNTAANNYQYACDNGAKTFELNTVLESTKYTATDNKASKDGGDDAGCALVVGSSACAVGSVVASYEVGNSLSAF